MNRYYCSAENCIKSYPDTKGLARHIRTEKAKEASKDEQLRYHSILIIRPRGRIPRQHQVADDIHPDPIMDAVDFELNEQEPGQEVLLDIHVPFNVYLFNIRISMSMSKLKCLTSTVIHLTR